jgi:hypothetical protein
MLGRMGLLVLAATISGCDFDQGNAEGSVSESCLVLSSAQGHAFDAAACGEYREVVLIAQGYKSGHPAAEPLEDLSETWAHLYSLYISGSLGRNGDTAIAAVADALVQYAVNGFPVDQHFLCSVTPVIRGLATGGSIDAQRWAVSALGLQDARGNALVIESMFEGGVAPMIGASAISSLKLMCQDEAEFVLIRLAKRPDLRELSDRADRAVKERRRFIEEVSWCEGTLNPWRNRSDNGVDTFIDDCFSGSPKL